MLKRFLVNLKAQHMQRLQEQKGQSIIIVTFAMIGLIAMLGLALDLGLVYIEKVKVNRAADASALAAVVELPYEQDTMNRAIEYIKLNGYDVGVDTEVFVRGCVVTTSTYIDAQGRSHVYNPGSAQNVGGSLPLTKTTLITGARYITSTLPARASFVIDMGGFQSSSADNCSATVLGTANRLRVAGVVNVPMSFMQFFGFPSVPVQDESVAENLSSLDVIVVFDISGSMEDQTVCHDCWVRTSYNSDYPNNGYFNPLPYNIGWATSGTGNVSIPNSNLCTATTPTPTITGTLKYLTVEAELYSKVGGPSWALGARTPGLGFWAIQRGSRDNGTNASVTNALGEDNFQYNDTGNINLQSSNVCNPNVGADQIDCTVGASGTSGDNVCSSTDVVGGKAADCSAYIMARPLGTYGQYADSEPQLSGAAYNSDCFINSGGVGSPGGPCWASGPFYSTIGSGPTNVPWVEYDFTPTWGSSTVSSTTYIWIRAMGGGETAYTWAGNSPATIPGDADGNPDNNVSSWKKVVYWQVNNGPITERNDEGNTNFKANDGYGWRNTRVDNTRWRWIKLGSTQTLSGTSYTLKLYQGSAGYSVDKIVFTNDSFGSTPASGGTWSIPAVLLRTLSGGTASSDGGTAIGPPASPGSATREACNLCNPAYGLQVSPGQCSCRLRNGTTSPTAAQDCTSVFSTTNQLNDDLYSGLQPLRSAQEAVKNFAKKLDPRFDQLGIVAFTADSGGRTDNTDVQASSTRRSKLQCLQWAQARYSNTARCYEGSAAITYTNVLSAVERQWPESGTNITIGMREGLVELGVTGYASNSDCSATINDGSSCDRRGAARRVIILMTDGAPNTGGNLCSGVGSTALDSYWEGLVGTEDDNFECPVYLAKQAADYDVTVYTIGIGAGANGDLLTAMAEGIDPHGGDPQTIFTNAKGGKYFNAAKPTDLELIFNAILSNIYVRIIS